MFSKFPHSSRVLPWLLAILAMGRAVVRAQANADDVAAAVRGLNDPNPDTRTASEQFLRKNGQAVRTALQSATTRDEPELAARARVLLNPAPPESSAVAWPPALARYRDAGLSERRRIILEANDRAGASLVAQAWGLERNPDLRQIAYGRLLEFPALAAPALVAESNPTLAGLVLDEAIRNDAVNAAETYAALAVARGTVDRAILDWTERGEKRPPDPAAQQVLAVLYRAKGDWPAAREAALLAGNPNLLQETFLAAGDWAAAADRIRRRASLANEILHSALLAACDHFAGNGAAFNDEVRDLVNKPADREEVLAAANALSLCDKPDDALALLRRGQQWSAAFNVLAARGRVDEAFALLSERDGDASNEAMFLRIAAAKLACRLGKTDRMSELFAQVAREANPTKAPIVFATMALAERECGRPQAMWEHFGQALAAATDDSVLLGPLSAVFADRDDLNWPALWRLLNESFPANQKKENFARMRALYERTIPPAEVRDLSRWNGHGPIQASVRGQLAMEAARRFLDAGDPTQAKALIDAEAQHTESPVSMLRLGDFAARDGDWVHAALWYGQAWNDDRSQALPLYLRAAALQHIGQAAAADEDMRTARALSGSDARQRYFVIRALEAHGLEDAIAGELKILLATAPSAFIGGDIAGRLAAAANERHDAAAEASFLRAMILSFSAGAFHFRDNGGYVTLPYRLHLTLARGDLESGNLKAMDQEIQTCRQLIADEINLAIELVPQLEHRGRHDLANTLFDDTHIAQVNLCTQFPDSGMRHNQLAWLDAECKRHLDEALDHAKRAVNLEPQKTAYIDTLAEVYFQRGQFDAAIEQMTRCIELEPKIKRHRAQLEKFKSVR